MGKRDMGNREHWTQAVTLVQRGDGSLHNLAGMAVARLRAWYMAQPWVLRPQPHADAGVVQRLDVSWPR